MIDEVYFATKGTFKNKGFIRNHYMIFLLTISFLFFLNCNVIGNHYNVPQKIIVAGKIDNYDSSKEIHLTVNRIGFTFVYICLNSEEKNWKAVLDKYQLGGQHYLLSTKQSAEIKSLFEISAVPFYLLIDKNGIIKEKGSHLRPFTAKDKIKNL